MKIHACSFGIAGATAISIVHTSLGLLLKFFPAQTLKYVGIIHMMPKLDYIKPFITVTPKAVAMGIISYAVLGFIVFWLIATIYNLFQK
jgi:hypothetical protein